MRSLSMIRYSPYSPLSPYGPQHGPPSTSPQFESAVLSSGSAPTSPHGPSPITPIMQSRTSKHDLKTYYASIDGHDRSLRDSRHRARAQRAKSEGALSIMAAHKKKEHRVDGKESGNPNDKESANENVSRNSKNAAKSSKRKKSKKFFSKISLPIFGAH